MKAFRILVVAVAIVFLVAGAVFAGGIARYGDMSSFAGRVRSAMAAPVKPGEVLPLPSTPARSANDFDTPVVLPTVTPTVVEQTNPAPPLEAPVVVEPSAVPVAEIPVVEIPVAEVAPVVQEPVVLEPVVMPDAPASFGAPADVASADISLSLVQPLAAANINGLRHEWQTWNNCGPATLSTYLSYYGSALTQADIGAVLRRSEDDKNVSPEELVDYARGQGMNVLQRVNGDSNLLRTLVSNGYPVLIETWLEDAPNDGMGHYRLVTGYDDAQQQWIMYDSYVATNAVAGGKNGGEYAGIYMPYALTDDWWKVFNRTYILVYPPHDEARIQAILGNSDETFMWQQAEQQARNELVQDSNDVFAWFNLGSSLWAQGRADEAAAAFDQARTIGLPWRMMWYQFSPFATYLSVNRANDALALADATLVNTSSIEEVHYWRGRALEALGNPDAARAAYRRAVQLYGGYQDAVNALNALGG